MDPNPPLLYYLKEKEAVKSQQCTEVNFYEDHPYPVVGQYLDFSKDIGRFIVEMSHISLGESCAILYISHFLSTFLRGCGGNAVNFTKKSSIWFELKVIFFFFFCFFGMKIKH